MILEKDNKILLKHFNSKIFLGGAEEGIVIKEINYIFMVLNILS